jgi:hypothetical protein
MMILAIPGEFGLDEYIVCPAASATGADLRKRMLERAKVSEGSYAFGLIDQLHTGIFIQSLDLKADFQTYFALEYRSFAQYLCRRERLSANVVSRLANAFDVSTGMYRFRPRHSFLEDASGVELLSRLLEDGAEGEGTV